MSTRSHLDNRSTLTLGRPPFDVAPPRKCGHVSPGGWKCGQSAYWLVPEDAYCKDHMPAQLILLAERRRTAWEWRAGIVWNEIVRSIQ